MTSAPRCPILLLSPGEVAAMLYVHPRTVTRWAKAGKLSSVRTAGGHRRFALSEVLRLMSGQATAEGTSTYEQVSAELVHDSPGIEAALLVSMAAVESLALGVLADAAAAAQSSRERASREADALVANEAARNVVAARIRADLAAALVREAAALAADTELACATPGDAEAVLRASRTAATVQEAAAQVAEEVGALAESVALAVATTAELMAANRRAHERVIAVEDEATADTLALRTAAATAGLS